MSIANYSEMVTAVSDWLNRAGFSDLESRIPDFIEFGQRRIHYTCDLDAMEDATTLTISGQNAALPADFLRVKALIGLQAGHTWELLGAPIRDVLAYSMEDRPNTYAIVGGQFYFGPPPDQAYTATLIYYKALPILSSVNTTNWFTENYPEILLAATIMEALVYLKDDARAAQWEQKFNQYKSALLRSEDRKSKDAGGMRVRLK